MIPLIVTVCALAVLSIILGWTTYNLMKIIMQLKEKYGLTLIIIEHILKVVMDTCNSVTVFDHGQKIAEGTPAQVKDDNAVIEAYLGKKMDDEEMRKALAV